MRVHNGVLVPDELAENATTEQLDAYAADVKRENALFIAAVLTVEAECERLGIDPEERRF